MKYANEKLELDIKILEDSRLNNTITESGEVALTALKYAKELLDADSEKHKSFIKELKDQVENYISVLKKRKQKLWYDEQSTARHEHSLKWFVRYIEETKKDK